MVETALSWIGGRAVINSVNLEEGDDPGTRLDSFLTLAKEFGAAVVCTCIDDRGPGPDGRLEGAGRHRHPRHRRRALRTPSPGPDVRRPRPPPVHGHGGEQARTASRPSKASGASRPSCPGSTPSSVSPTSRSASTRRPVRSSTPSSSTSASRPGWMRPSSMPPRSCPCPRSTIGPDEVCLDLVYDRRHDGYDPLTELLALFEGVSASPASPTRTASDWTVERRLEHRIVDGDRNGHRGRSRRGHGRRAHAAGHHQRFPAGRHEDGGRTVRLGRDAAAVRPRLGRDHEVGGGLSRALHGEGRPGRQGHHGAGHRQGRRARHRQEPGRHHPDQQRLHGEEPRDQGGDHRHGGAPSRSARPTPSG